MSALAALIALVASLLGSLAPMVAEVLPACQTEDEVGFCYWDASERGNGEGQSFLVIGEDVIYLD